MATLICSVILRFIGGIVKAFYFFGDDRFCVKTASVKYRAKGITYFIFVFFRLM
jgi:hypothetical protein